MTRRARDCHRKLRRSDGRLSQLGAKFASRICGQGRRGSGRGGGVTRSLPGRGRKAASCAIELLRRATKGGDSTRWVRKRELRAQHMHAHGYIMEGRQATVTGFLLPLEHGVGRAWPRSSGNYGAHKKLDYARLIDAAEEGEELVGRSVRLLGRGMRAYEHGTIFLSYLFVGYMAFHKRRRVWGQQFTRKWSREGEIQSTSILKSNYCRHSRRCWFKTCISD